MQAILECCCGVDVHKDMIEACIIQGIENPKIIRQQFSTMQNELQDFVRWLYDNDCYHIAMESTGVYWRPVYECIEEFSPYYEDIIVANAHHMRNLPGRKTDVKDAEWIATLLQHGLLEKSYVPSRDIRDLRELSRSYKNYVGERVRCINRLEKFLQTHGFKLSSVLSDITRLCSWAGLSPRNDQSAGKISSKKIMPGNPYIKSILCQSAWAAVRSRNTPFAAWFWSRQAKIGTKKAIIGVSRRLLATIFVLLKNDQFYDSDIAMRSFSA